MRKIKLVRISTVSLSLDLLLKGQLDFLNKFFNVIAISSPDKRLINVSHRENVKTIGVPMKRKISLFFDLFSLVYLWIIFLLERPKIVHSITPKAGLLSMIAAKFAGVPIRMHTFTGLIFPTQTGIKKWILIIVDKILCWASTNIYAEGLGVKYDLEINNIHSKKIKIIANGNINGIDCEYYSIDSLESFYLNSLRNTFNINQDDFVFIYVGRIVSDKGINELVLAFTSLNLANAKLLLVGPFENDDPIQVSTYSQIQSNENIITTGFQDDVRGFLAIANAFVLPSYREGFPNSLMQAGAMGLPSIVTNINGANEIISDYVNGLVVPPRETFELKKKMLELYDDKILYHKLKSNSRQMIISRFQQNFLWDAQLDEYILQLREKNIINL